MNIQHQIAGLAGLKFENVILGSSNSLVIQLWVKTFKLSKREPSTAVLNLLGKLDAEIEKRFGSV